MPMLRVWRMEDFGAALNNWRVAVHPAGLVYFANNDGVLEFDGEHWRFIALPRGGSARSLAIDAHGRVWVGGHNDLCRLEPDARGDLHAVSLLEALPAGERDVGTISRATVANEGVYLRSARRLILFRNDGGIHTWAAADTPGMIWAMGGELFADLGPLVRVQGDALTPVQLGGNEGAKNFLRVFAARSDAEGGWILLTAHGPARWRGPGSSITPMGEGRPEQWQDDVASAGVFLPDGRFALGTERAGLYLLAPDGSVLQHIDRAQGLPGNRINDLAVDAEGGLWLAMQEGIAHVAVSAPFARHGAPQGLTATARRFASYHEQLFLAHSEGLSRRDPASGRFVTIEGFQVGSNRPLVIGERLVASTRGLREITADDQSRAWTSELIGPIVASRRAADWIFAGSATGLWLIAPVAVEGAKGWRTLGRVTAIDEGIDDILDSDDGYVWAVTRAGRVWRVDFSRGLAPDSPAREFGPERGVPLAMRRDHVRLLKFGPEIFAVAAGWVRRFDSSAQRFVADGRLGGGVLAVGAAVDGGYWLQPAARPECIMHVRVAAAGGWETSEISIAPFRGFPINGLFEEPTTRTLWLAGEGPLMSVDLAWQPAPRAAPLSVHVRRVVTGDDQLVFGGAADRASKSEPVLLPPAQNTLRFEFAAQTFLADYLGRGQTEYRTRLDGLDRRWSRWTVDTHREFTNLPYRALVFHVQARGVDGRESADTAFAFAIQPPWWRTWWCIGLLSLSGIGGVAGVTRWFANRAFKRRLVLLEAQSAVERERLRLARDLHDEVGAGLGRVILFAGEAEREKGDPQKLSASLARVRASAQELVQHAREIVWAVSPQHDTLASVIERLGDYAQETLRAAGIACRVDAPPGAMIPPVTLGSEARHSLFLAVKEAVHNCVKYAEAKSAEFSLQIDGGDFMITLRDHGRGFAPGERRGSGHGTRNLLARAEALGGRAEIASEPGKGTTVTVRVPLSNARH